MKRILSKFGSDAAIGKCGRRRGDACRNAVDELQEANKTHTNTRNGATNAHARNKLDFVNINQTTVEK